MSDEDLMLDFQNGKQRAFDEIYRRYSQRVLYFMYRLFNHDEAAAQDALHDVFLKLVENPFLFDTDRQFKPWLFTAAANAGKKQYRDHRGNVQTEDIEIILPAKNQEVAAAIDNKIFKRELRNALNELSYAHRCTFILRYQEGFAVAEVSDIMNCSEGTVKSRAFHCLKKLSERMPEFDPNK